MTAKQLPLTGLSPGRAADRLFFAVFPDAASAGRIEAIAQRLRSDLGLRGRCIARERLHLTLQHLGDHAGLPDGLVDAAHRAADALVATPFDLAFDKVGSFRGRPGNRPLVLRGEAGIAGIVDLQQRLGACLRTSGLGHCVAPRFTPHVTLLYDDAIVPERPVPPVSWRVDEIRLVHSLLGRTEHRILGGWRLPDHQDPAPVTVDDQGRIR